MMADGRTPFERADVKRRLAEADAAVADASLRVRRQREELAELWPIGDVAEAARAQAALDLLEDSMSRRIANRNWLFRIFGASEDEP